MHRSRLIRRLVALATVTAALVLPAVANAAASIDLDLASPTSLEANAVHPVTVTVSNGGPDPASAGTVTLSASSGAEVVGVPVKAGVGAAFMTVSNGSFVITAGALPSGVSATITFQVRTPKTYNEDFGFRAVGAGGSYANELSGPWVYAVNSKGGPSRIIQRFTDVVPAAGSTGLANKWVALGGQVNTSVSVTNYGAGAAHYVVLGLGTNSYENPVFSPLHVPENPNNLAMRFNSGTACVPIAPQFTTCEIETLAPGATVVVPVVSSATTHFGTFQPYMSSNVEKADNGSDNGAWIGNSYVENDTYGDYMTVTDGTTTSAEVELEGPRAAAPGTSITYRGSAVNDGPNPITNGLVRIYAPTFFADGSHDSSVAVGAAGALPSVESVTTAYGATCTRAIERWDDGGTWKTRELLDTYDCPVASLAPGARAAFTVVAKFQTSRVSTRASAYMVRASMSASIFTRGYNLRDALEDSVGYVTTELNPTEFVDLDVSVASQATVGADRAGMQRVTIRNAGTITAEHVTLEGRVYGTNGQFETSIMPTACTGVLKPNSTFCALGDLAAGKSVSIDVPVRAGKKLGTLVSRYEAQQNSGSEFERDNNSTGHSVQIVKANTVPLLGVVVAKPKATSLASVGKTGLKTKVTTPGAASVKVSLILPARVALATGLIKKPKKGAAKDLVIGASTSKATKAGAITATTKLSKKYAKKLMAAKSKLTVKREVVVVSTVPLSAGANAKSTSSLSLVPAKKAKK